MDVAKRSVIQDWLNDVDTEYACSASDADNTASGWFLHNNNSSSGAPAALYQRVRDLFHTRSPGPRVPAEGQEAPAMTGNLLHGSRQSEEPDDSIMTGKESDSLLAHLELSRLFVS
ncbi:hypothetical protein HF086_011533 [Spodoptera exigua]|uniref:Uncharacterized protein n=1 Tax=Spodoptera exigua TaxID=7107 RepID=A0A922MCZ8_SPOEX|nr:hypothetical protein HF086_011533 [Spodoptera exigua]